jgi:HK97 family phage portal protein
LGVKAFLSSINPFNYRNRERRSLSTSYSNAQYAEQFLNVFGLFGNSSGKSISKKQAMRMAAVYTCVSVRADAVSMLPFNIFRYKNKESNQKSIAWEHPAYKLLHTRPNPWQTATQFWKRVMIGVDIDGESFVRITRQGGFPVRLDIIKWGDVEVLESNGNPYYKIKGIPVDYSDVLHFKNYTDEEGKRGLSVIQEHQETFGSKKNQIEYGNRNLNAVPPVYATTPNGTNVRSEGQTSLKDKLVTWAQEFFTEGKIPILTNGMELKTIGMKAGDAAYLEQIDATEQDIFGIFKTPPTLAYRYKAGVTYNNQENQNLQFLIYTLSPLLKNIEEEVDEKMFSEREQVNYYSKFNVAALLRTDLKTQAEWLTAMFKIGVYSQNKILGILDENEIGALGDRYYIEGNNMVPIDKIDELIASKAKPPEQKQPLSEETKKRLKEKFNGRSKEIINFFEQ